MKKLYYSFTDPEINDAPNVAEVEEIYFASKASTHSCWFKNLPTNVSQAVLGEYIPSIRKFISVLLDRYGNGESQYALEGGSLATVRTCPAVKGILDNSIVVKAPCDIHIRVFEDGTLLSKVKDPSKITISGDHPPAQFETLNGVCNIFKNSRAVKLVLPIKIWNTYKIPWLILGAQYHSPIKGLTTLPGVISGKHTKGESLSIIDEFKVTGEAYDIIINQGDALAYIWSPEPLQVQHRASSAAPLLLVTHKFIGN